MKLVLPKAVREEAREAINYYELELPGLGVRFWEEVDATVRWILLNAEVPRLRAGGYRRVNLRTFPFYVAYALRGEAVVLLAVAHAARNPEYWIDRLR